MGITTTAEELIERSRANVSAATKADPCVITTDGAHGLDDDDVVHMGGVGGMAELNNVVAPINVLSSTTFELTGIDSTGYATYTSGGLVIQRIGTAAQHNVGTKANQVVQLNSSAQLPPVDGSLLTGIAKSWSMVDSSKAMSGLATVEFTGILAASRELMLVVRDELYGVADRSSIQLGHAGAYITANYDGVFFEYIRGGSGHNEIDYAAGLDYPSLNKAKESFMKFHFLREQDDKWLVTGQGFRYGAGSIRHAMTVQGYVDVTTALTKVKLFSVGANTWSQGQATLYER